MAPTRATRSAVRERPAARHRASRPAVCRGLCWRLLAGLAVAGLWLVDSSAGPSRGDGRRAGHPGRHRHAARRSAAGLRLSGGTDAGPDGVRAGSGRVRPRLRARAADAAVARVDVHRPPAVRAQGPRQPRVHAEAGHADAGRDVSRRRDTRPAGSCRRTSCGPRPASRRDSTSTTRRFRRWPPTARSRRSSGPGRRRWPPPKPG